MAETNDPNKILVLQWGGSGCAAFKYAALWLNLEHGVNFLLEDSPDKVKSLVYNHSEPQLLITGIVSSNPLDLRAFVTNLRIRNPELMVVLYSSIRFPKEWFDRVVMKLDDDSFQKLGKTIDDFRSGAFRHSELEAMIM